MDLSPEHTDAGQALWQTCIDQLAQELPQQQFNTWIKPLQAIVSEDFAKVSVVVVNGVTMAVARAGQVQPSSATVNRWAGPGGRPTAPPLGCQVRPPSALHKAPASMAAWGASIICRAPRFA